jgi:hypothetical protein
LDPESDPLVVLVPVVEVLVLAVLVVEVLG